MILAGREIRSLGRNASTMEAAAKEVTTFLYNCFRIRGTQDHCCALVRCFKTHPYDQLPPTLQAIAVNSSSHLPCTPTCAASPSSPAAAINPDGTTLNPPEPTRPSHSPPRKSSARRP